MYRSTDAGETWTYLGLHDTRSIGRVVLDPDRSERRLRRRRRKSVGSQPERGVFKTTDAGRTWTKVLYVDSFTGATDLVMDPRDPKVLYAATYQRLRKAFGFNGGGPGSAIYKTTDAGATWKKLENGIPAGDKGRIGLALALSKPDVLIATIEHAGRRRHVSHRRRRRDVEADERDESAADVLQQADDRSQQRQAHLAARRLHRQERGRRRRRSKRNRRRRPTTLV